MSEISKAVAAMPMESKPKVGRFENREAALIEAGEREAAKERVIVIQSGQFNGKPVFYVEPEDAFVRAWESVIYRTK